MTINNDESLSKCMLLSLTGSQLFRRTFINHLSRNTIRNAIAGLLAIISLNAHAITLIEAVDAQLGTVSLPCDQLLAGDPVSVLEGELANICSRAVPLGSTAQSAAGNSSSLSTLSSSPMTSVESEKVQEKMELGSQWTLFFTAESEILDRDITTQEDGFDSTALRLLAGLTYALDARSNMGLALTMQEHKGDYDSGGDFKAETTGIRLMALKYFSDQFFIQAMGGIDQVSSQRTRSTSFDEYFNGGLVFSTNGNPSSDFDYDQTELSVLAGYDYVTGNITVTPQLGLTWLNIDFGTYSEAGNSGLELTFHDDERESLQSVLGIQTTMAVSTGYGVALPQLDLRWIHEFEDKSREVNVSFTHDTRSRQFYYDTEAGDRNFVELGAGAVFVFSGGNQAFVRIQTLLEHDYYDNYIFSAGFNIEL